MKFTFNLSSNKSRAARIRLAYLLLKKKKKKKGILKQVY